MVSGGTCLSSAAASSNSIAVTVNPLPQGSLTANGPFCTSGIGQLTFTATAGGTGPFTIIYYDGTTNQTATNVASGTPFDVFTNPVTSNTTYTLVSVANATCTRSSGFTGGSATITVNPTPATPTITGGPTTFCAGGSVILTSSAGSGNQWFLNGSPISGAINPTYTATASGNYTVVQTQLGCPSASSAITTVTVNPTPATPTITGGPTTFCAGSSVTLTSDATSGNQWFLNGSPISGAINPTYTATASGNYTVVQTLLSCPSAASAITTVTVNPTPATPTITGGPTTFCAGGSVILTSSAGSGNQWFLNGSPIGGATNTTYTATASGNYTVVQTQLGCPGAASAITTVTVNPNLTPTVSIAANPSGAICAGTSVTFTATAASLGGGTATYDFQVNGSSVQNSSSTTYTSTTLTNGQTVTCVITVTGGTCLTSTTATSNSITETVNPNFTPTVSITANPAGAICAGTSVTFTATAASLGGGTANLRFPGEWQQCTKQ